MKYLSPYDILIQSKTKKLIKLLDLEEYIIYSSGFGRTSKDQEPDYSTFLILKIIKITEDHDNMLNTNDYKLTVKSLYSYDSSMETPKKMTGNTMLDNYYNMKKRIVYKSNSLEDCLNIVPSLLSTNKYNI